MTGIKIMEKFTKTLTMLFFFLMMESPGGVFVFLFVLSFLCSFLLYNEGRTQARQPLEAYLR